MWAISKCGDIALPSLKAPKAPPRHHLTWSGDPYGEGASWGFGSMDSRIKYGYDDREESDGYDDSEAF